MDLLFCQNIGEIPTHAATIRQSVFIDEQGFSQELDDIDNRAVHIVAYNEDQPIATGRVFVDDNGEWHIGRVAVLQNFRRQGVGRMIMSELERVVVRAGADTVVLGAQLQAKDFYENLGYTAYGEIHYDEFSPHVHMKKSLQKT